MNRITFKFAASTMIISITMVAATAQSQAMRQAGMPGRAAAAGDRQSSELFAQARRDLQQGRVSEARVAMEQAVALSPRDAGYRLLLADVYLKQGRFESARATYGDVLELDPSNQRAGLSFSLMQIALDRPQAAIAQLDTLAGRASAADVGLAMALAGAPERAIEILEPAARSPSATPRIRQNLALAHALAGDWRRARAIASQDLSPADVGPRLEQWAAFARPGAAANQVAALLGVSPVADPGQPVALALSRPAPAPVQVAAVEAPVVAAPEAAAPVQAAAVGPDTDWGLPAAAPIQVAAAEAPASYAPVSYTPVSYAPASDVPPAPAPTEEEVQAAIAARAMNRPAPSVMRTAAVSLPAAPVFRRAAARPVAAAAPEVRMGDSQFVVQLGAFSNEGNAEAAWVEFQQRYGLTPYAPLAATIEMDGRTLHRVAIAGFASHEDAQSLCGSLRARGGECFVRSSAGDASVRWAARYADRNTRDA
ncbi:MAG: tetratricopeptide repeat protein [Sphingosinicella sp.]|uniref:tetratricopeptide repeat protein n=1 Tax=Sphingosinicella sp. TaxID=1917971 RepID=UPI004037E402